MESIVTFLDDNEAAPYSLVKPRVAELELPEVSQLFSYNNNLQGEIREEDLGVDMCEDRSNTRSSPFDDSAKSISLELSASTLDKLQESITFQAQRETPFVCSKGKAKKNSSKRLYSGSNLDLPSCYDLEGKIKLERNRISARECRIRKKIYVANLEQQMKELKLELNQCRKELHEYKTKEQQQVFANFFNTPEVTLENLSPNLTEEDKKLSNKKQLNSYFVN